MKHPSLDALANAANQSEGTSKRGGGAGSGNTAQNIQGHSIPEPQQQAFSNAPSGNGVLGGNQVIPPQLLQQLQTMLQNQNSASTGYQNVNLTSPPQANVLNLLQQLQQRPQQQQLPQLNDPSALLMALQKQNLGNQFLQAPFGNIGGMTSQTSPPMDTQSLKSNESQSSSSQHAYSKMPPPTNHFNASTVQSSLESSYGSLSGNLSEGSSEGKREQKRAANRKSAQLSRKRKKQFIEELRDENDLLRRKEQILRSIPDLIVVFDSSGKICFVSESVSRFISYSAQELEGQSFWERICPDSVRLLKAAFMDSLAARTGDNDTAPLGNGFWELRLVDKDKSPKTIVLNGVVHFAGDRPECVCSIRERIESSGETISVMPDQSVIGATSEDPASKKVKSNRKIDSVMRISDSGNSSGSSRAASEQSESGSCDEGATGSN